MSWAMPSVTKIAPPTRSGGVSLNACAQRAEQLRCPYCRGRRAASRRSALRHCRAPASCFSISARAASVCAFAFAEPIARRAVDDDGDDVFQRTAVLALQAGIERARAAATPRRARAERRAGPAPERSARRRRNASDRQRLDAAAAAGRGEKASDQAFNATAFPADPSRGPDRLCNCRSARTSPD